MEIILTNVSPSCLTEPVFINVKDGEDLIKKYLDDMFNKLKFTFANSKNLTFKSLFFFWNHYNKYNFKFT